MKLLSYSKPKQEGFTLIELLVVVAIISLLSSIVLASLKDSKEKAEAVATRQYMGEVIKAIELYRSENNNLPTDQFLSELISSKLSSFISFKPLSNRIIDNFIYNGVLQPYYSITVPANYSCGKVSSTAEEPYIVYFNSVKQLNIPRVITDSTGLPHEGGGFKYYCASIIAR